MLNDGGVVFLLDVDNTLLDNDRFAGDLGAHLQRVFGAAERDRYWSIFAKLRDEFGVADYLASLQVLRTGLEDAPELLLMSEFMLQYPFASLLFPAALDAVAHLRKLGLPVVLSDGDVVFQPRKIQRSGIWDAVEGRVLIYVHKERSLERMQRRFPGAHYVMVDDKANLLADMKRALGRMLTTVFVRQGHYARALETLPNPPPDLAIERIGDLIHHDLSDFKERA
jgi:FMN phosphatase YigB (HAD superfamily)